MLLEMAADAKHDEVRKIMIGSSEVLVVNPQQVLKVVVATTRAPFPELAKGPIAI